MSNESFENKIDQVCATPSVDAMNVKKQSRRDYEIFLNIFAGLGVADSIGSILMALCFVLLCWNASTHHSQTLGILLIFGVCMLWVSLGTSALALIDGIACFVVNKKGGKSVGGLPTAAFVLGLVSFLLCWGTAAALVISDSAFL